MASHAAAHGAACEAYRRVLSPADSCGAAAPPPPPFWDVIVLLVADAEQAKQFGDDIAMRVQAGVVPNVKYHCFADGPRRIGNGGALIQAIAKLALIYPPEDIERFRTLILPCGGYSKRLPQWGPRGKLFAPLPAPRPGGDEPMCMFDAKLMSYVSLVGRLPPGTVYLGWSDCLEFFDAAGVELDREGFTVLGHVDTMAHGCSHAVLVAEGLDPECVRSATYPVKHFFEKPSVEQMREHGAVFSSSHASPGQRDAVIVDSDFFLCAATARLLAAFYGAHEPLRFEIDSGSHMLQAITTPAAAPLAAGAGLDEGERLRAELKAHLHAHAVGLSAAVLVPSTFYHIGSLEEYRHYYAVSGVPEVCSERAVFSTGSGLHGAQEGCLLHSTMEAGSVVGAGSVVEYAQLSQGVQIGRACPGPSSYYKGIPSFPSNITREIPSLPSARRALLTLQVDPGSLYRCGRSD